jgi:hypothetical protein
MIITDLNYMEISAESSNIEGGGWFYNNSPNTAYANASANALAFGKKTTTSTYVSTGTVTTNYSSGSGSYASSFSKTY